VATSKWVQAHRLRHGFPGTADLFADLSFALNPGDVVAVCGPSGCGKSTLLAILAGWQRPTAGHLEVVGIDRIGWVFQNPYGVSGRTALDHVVFPFLVRGLTISEAERQALRAMARFDLVQVRGRRFRELSGGEAQRLMLARAVSAGADLLLVDEPTAQLDLTTASTVNRTLTNLAQEGTIVVIATHDPGTRAACGRVIDLTQADR
jgi:ABC-type lipoprotein export system ATPase subunit